MFEQHQYPVSLKLRRHNLQFAVATHLLAKNNLLTISINLLKDNNEFDVHTSQFDINSLNMDHFAGF